MNVIVTGGAGYIGSHTVKALQASGMQPLIFDNFSTGHRAFLRSTPFFEGDVDRFWNVDLDLLERRRLLRRIDGLTVERVIGAFDQEPLERELFS